MLFSEGLPASPALEANLQAVVEAANRANITVYAIDASGLRVISGTHETRVEIEEATKERLRQLAAPNDYTEEPIMRLSSAPRTCCGSIRRPASRASPNDTGGFLVSETNNLRGALRRIDEDTRFHYLLTYVPSNNNFDGRFRAIGVKVQAARRGRLRAQRLPRPAPTPAVPVMGYEGPALAVLDAAKLPNGFPFSSA